MRKQFHYIYKITNKTNNKEYIGVHSSDKEFDEAYWSSSYYLNEDIKALGKHNFERIVLSYHPSREEAMKAEAELVNKEYTNSENTYNVVCGGHGPNWIGTVIAKDLNGNNICAVKSDERFKTGELVGIMKGIPMSEETKEKLSKAFEGKIWINKDEKNIRVWPNELEHYLSLGWIKGRTYHNRKPHSKETRSLIGKANSLCIRSKEYKENISEQFKNRIWISKEKESKFIDKSELSFYISNEWKIGRSPFKWKKNR